MPLGCLQLTTIVRPVLRKFWPTVQGALPEQIDLSSIGTKMKGVDLNFAKLDLDVGLHTLTGERVGRLNALSAHDLGCTAAQPPPQLQGLPSISRLPRSYTVSKLLLPLCRPQEPGSTRRDHRRSHLVRQPLLHPGKRRCSGTASTGLACLGLSSMAGT
jgi:hypothetical protein